LVLVAFLVCCRASFTPALDLPAKIVDVARHAIDQVETGSETRMMGWMTQFVLRCAAIAEMAAGTKQRFASLCPFASLSGE
jgi:hypothetical protein